MLYLLLVVFPQSTLQREVVKMNQTKLASYVWIISAGVFFFLTTALTVSYALFLANVNAVRELHPTRILAPALYLILFWIMAGIVCREAAGVVQKNAERDFCIYIKRHCDQLWATFTRRLKMPSIREKRYYYLLLAALAMFAEKNEKSARFCSGTTKEKEGYRAWVEFHHLIWWVIDPSYPFMPEQPVALPRIYHHRKVGLQTKSTCSYEEFWGVDEFGLAYDLMLKEDEKSKREALLVLGRTVSDYVRLAPCQAPRESDSRGHAHGLFAVFCEGENRR